MFLERSACHGTGLVAELVSVGLRPRFEVFPEEKQLVLYCITLTCPFNVNNTKVTTVDYAGRLNIIRSLHRLVHSSQGPVRSRYGHLHLTSTLCLDSFSHSSKVKQVLSGNPCFGSYLSGLKLYFPNQCTLALPQCEAILGKS